MPTESESGDRAAFIVRYAQTMSDESRKGRIAVVGFAAGFLATLLFHQPVLALLKAAKITSRGAYAMEPVPPFGVPSVISLAFWGGVWGIALMLLIAGRRNAIYWTMAALVGAIAPTLVAGLIISPLKGQPIPADARASMLVMGLIVNAAWGLGTAAFARVFGAHR